MTVNQVADLKRKFIIQQQKLLGRQVSALEGKLYDAILNKLIAELEKSEGRIISNNKNIDLASSLNKIFDNINKSEYMPIIKSLSNDLNQIIVLNKTYFSIIEEDKKKLEKISKEVNSIMNKRLGLDTSGEVVSKGYLDRLITDSTLQNKVKEMTYKAITSGKRIEDYKSQIKRIITGDDKVVGSLEKHFQTFAYDTYTQVDRTTSKMYAVKLDLKAFVYAGGEISTSRCFCENNNGKVFTTEEAERWRGLLNQECGPIWNEDTDGSYDPLIDMGGYNCRHVADFISNTLAKKKRPDLVGVLD